MAFCLCANVRRQLMHKPSVIRFTEPMNTSSDYACFDITRPRRCVYVCSPYSGNTIANQIKAAQFAKWYAFYETMPVVPHLYFNWFLSNEHDCALISMLNCRLISHTNELWVVADTISRGMKEEIDYARTRNKSIHYFSRTTTKDISC